jgi:histone H3/H4
VPIGIETLANKDPTMAKKKKAKKKGSPAELIISKSRTKGATKKCNVSSEFYGALDKVVRDMIKGAEGRAIANKRKTLKPQDL